MRQQRKQSKRSARPGSDRQQQPGAMRSGPTRPVPARQPQTGAMRPSPTRQLQTGHTRTDREMPPPDQLEGRHPVLEALQAGRPLRRILLARGARGGPMRQIAALARELGVEVREVERDQLDRLAPGRNHQGVIAFGTPKATVSLDDLLSAAQSRGEDPFLILLDGIEDPYNLGSLIRSADGAGAHGIVIPERRAAPLTATVAKASAGALEHVPVAQVVNLTRTAEELKEQGCWVIGADAAADETLWDVDLTGPVALVVGSEGKGISANLRKHCDRLVHLPMQGQVGSLNAGVAGALLMYEVARQRQQREQRLQREQQGVRQAGE